MLGANRPLRVCAGLLVLALAWLLPLHVLAGRHSMIPPGQEQRVRAFVDDAIAAARAANELPIEVAELVDIHIDRDRVRVVLHPRSPAAEPPPMLVIFHPEAVPDDVVGSLAPGVLAMCGPPEARRDCQSQEAEPWRGLAGRVAASRAPVADLVWQLEELQGGAPRSDASAQPDGEREDVWVDRIVALAALLAGLAVAAVGIRRGRGRPEAIRGPELGALALLLLGFVLAASSFTPMLPMHEHNTFVARSDCAIDPSCRESPGGAWNMTTMHVYGLLLAAIPYHARALAWLSLACGVITLLLAWALARVLLRALGHPQLGPLAGLASAGVLATHPVAWRLAGAATFWPWALAWAFAAALAGVWAGLAAGDEDRRVRWAGALAWLVAAACLAIACGGNHVLLTLGACLLLAPLAWRPLDRPALGRALWIAPAALAVFALAAWPDYVLGHAKAFGGDGLDDSLDATALWRHFDLLLLDARVSTRAWVVPLVAALAWPRTRVLVPLAYAWVVPGLFLALAAGEIIGSGYPVGFINHTWELWWSAIAVGLGLAWIAWALERVCGPLSERLPVPDALSWGRLGLGCALAWAALAGPRVEQGWQLATREDVLQRELVELERAFVQLPEHDLLIVAPRVLAPLTDAPTQWDPLEVWFPRGFYAHAMRARGLEPAPVIELDHLGELKPGERALFYLGSSLRSFQPHEIADAAVPDDLERPDVRALHDRFAFEPVYEFHVLAEQHPAISQRLGADRGHDVVLGFYWLKAKH